MRIGSGEQSSVRNSQSAISSPQSRAQVGWILIMSTLTANCRLPIADCLVVLLWQKQLILYNFVMKT
jgi:hypothetical protein